MGDITYQQNGFEFSKPSVDSLNGLPDPDATKSHNYELVPKAKAKAQPKTQTQPKAQPQQPTKQSTEVEEVLSTLPTDTYHPVINGVMYTTKGQPDAWHHDYSGGLSNLIVPGIFSITIMLTLFILFMRYTSGWQIHGYAHKHRRAGGPFRSTPGEPEPRAFGRPGDARRKRERGSLW